MRKVLPHIHLLKLGLANAYLLEEENELSLIDTGPEGSEQRIFNYIHGIGRNPEELTQIIVTHSHPDHAGSAAALKKATRARIYMHPKDADMVAAGKALRNGGQISPGIIHKMVYNLMLKGVRKEIPAFEADELVGDGDLLPVAGGLRVLHNPGHTEGHIALISTNGEILFASDSCSNVVGLTSFPYYENLEQAHIDLEQLCQHQFEVAFFGHGSPVMEKAAQKFRAKFAGSEMSLA